MLETGGQRRIHRAQMGVEPVRQTPDVVARQSRSTGRYAAGKMRQFAEYAQMFAVVFADGRKPTALHQLALVLEMRPRMLAQTRNLFHYIR